MKHSLLFITVVLLASCSLFNKQNAVTYNNDIIHVQDKIIFRINELATAFGTKDSATMFPKLDAYRNTADSAVKIVEKMDGFDGSTELRDAALNLFKYYKTASENELLEEVNLLKKQEISEADMTELNKIVERNTATETPLDEAFATAQSNFATKYNFKLEKSKEKK